MRTRVQRLLAGFGSSQFSFLHRALLDAIRTPTPKTHGRPDTRTHVLSPHHTPFPRTPLPPRTPRSDRPLLPVSPTPTLPPTVTPSPPSTPFDIHHPPPPTTPHSHTSSPNAPPSPLSTHTRTPRAPLSPSSDTNPLLPVHTSSTAHSSMRSAAGSLKRPCVAKAKTRAAPNDLRALAAT